jgi:hypothetical protein
VTDQETPASRPPAGGFGAQASGQTGVEHRAIEPGHDLRVLHVVFMAFGAAILSLGLLVVWGQWRKQKDIRAAEARNNVGEIAKGVAATYQTTGQLCPSARAIPADVEEVRGKTYTSRHAEWEDDPGWSCAGLRVRLPAALSVPPRDEGRPRHHPRGRRSRRRRPSRHVRAARPRESRAPSHRLRHVDPGEQSRRMIW